MRTSSHSRSLPAAALLTLAALAHAVALQEAPPVIDIGKSSSRVSIAPCSATVEPLRTSCGIVREVLKTDLDFEGFQLTPESLMRSLPLVDPKAPNYLDWKSVGANILVTLEVTQTGTDFVAEARTFAVDTSSSIMSKRYNGKVDPANPSSFRAFAHQAAEDILSLASIPAVTRTRLVFVSDRDYPDKRRKELYISDYDGFNVRQITVNRQLSILPAWTPGGEGIIYTSYRNGDPQIYLSWIYQGRIIPNATQERPGTQAFAAVVSPDGKKVAYSSNRAGTFDIWVSNIDGTGARNLTGTPAQDTAPCWSPSGLEIAFTSGRSGSAQLWVMDQEGLNLRRLSTVSNYNDACAWNPSREFAEIAYTSRLENNEFEIAVMDLATGQVRQLTTGRGSCEYPSWAPNGRHLIFSCNRSGTWQLNQIDRLGTKLRPIAVGPGNSMQADWSQPIR